ncbi:hypothetical protein [Actinosynnema sp.]|uniref:hypothetical protein n=1 Tax=Actinosynnema sp. TaxID=1872144 RepID=UPI003F8570F5
MSSTNEHGHRSNNPAQHDHGLAAATRRREAARRLPPLADGHHDPLHPQPSPAPMHPDATAATIAHLRALGFGWIPLPHPDLRAMWRAGGAHARLAAEQAELNARHIA